MQISSDFRRFEREIAVARKLTPILMEQFNRQTCDLYIGNTGPQIEPEIRSIIFDWTRGYPLAIDVMVKAIQNEKLDPTRPEDQQQLLAILFEEVIDRGVLYLDIDDLTSAENAFREAHEIYVRSGYKPGVAATSNRLGQVEMARRNFSKAMEWLKKGYAASLGIHKESQINSLSKQGQVFVLQNEPENSLPLFREAIALAQDVHDYYQLAETLARLAHALEQLKQRESSQKILKEAEDLARRYSYNLLVGRIEESRGDSFYQVGDYHHAFEHYGAYCYYMTLYNSIKYNRALRKLVDRLLMTPKSVIPSITATIIEYWLKQGLTMTYPELVSVCEEVQDMLRP